MQKRVYFSAGMYESCNYLRCLLPLIHNGWDGDYTSIGGRRKEVNSALRGMMYSDIVVFQRPMEKVRLAMLDYLHEMGKMVVFDNDDTYKVEDRMKYGETLDALNNNIDDFIRKADLVTTTTEFLAEEYRLLNRNVVVLPNMVDPSDWPKPKRNNTKKVRIGLIGSINQGGDVDHIKDVLAELKKRDDVEIVIFAAKKTKDEWFRFEDDFKFWEDLNPEWHGFVPVADYFETLNNLKLDMMLIPRSDTYFNRCKSNVKFLEASMLEIPVIAQGFSDGKSPYQGEEDSKYMTIVTDNQYWLHEIDALIADKKLRRQMGVEARRYVLKNYNIKDNAHLWAETYENIYNRK